LKKIEIYNSMSPETFAL